MDFLTSENCETLQNDAQLKECIQGDPHCGKNFGELCEKGCFEVTIDFQNMAIIEGAG